MDIRGQGALEYLLLIGGAVLVAAIVIALISGIPPTVSPACAAECSALTAPASADPLICVNHVVSGDCKGLCKHTVAAGCYFEPTP